MDLTSQGAGTYWYVYINIYYYECRAGTYWYVYINIYYYECRAGTYWYVCMIISDVPRCLVHVLRYSSVWTTNLRTTHCSLILW